ncbi:MAG: oligosaccharide flippase family protein [Pseudomonadota bacterium]
MRQVIRGTENPVFRVALLIFSGNAGGALLSLLRNLLIARLITVEDFGIAATFAMAITVVEMVSNLGMNQQMVQSKEGADPAFQASLQGFHLLRSALSALILFFAAGWIAEFMGIPEVAWAYQVLAIVPLARGFQHFDVHRLKREMRFAIDTFEITGSNALALLCIYPAFFFFGDYRVMLAAIIVQVVVSVAITHVMAERRYELRLDRRIIASSVAFGWPLLLNGALLFAVFNGEKIIVGRELSLELLGILAMGFTLTLPPTLVFMRFVQNFFLPQLSALQDDRAAFMAMATVTLQAVLLTILVYLGAMLLVGRPFVDWFLGAKYADLVPLLLWLALLQAMRVMKAGAAVVALAQAQTSNALVANLARLTVLPVIWILAAGGHVGLLEIIWLATLGEAVGLVVSVQMVRRYLNVSMRPMLVPMAATLAVMVVLAVIAWRDAAAAQIWSPWPELVVMAAVLAAATVTLRSLWGYIQRREMTRFESGASPS